MRIKLVMFAMLACITSTMAVGQTVSVNYNRSQSFSQYHSYAWGSNNTNQIQNSILAQVAQQSIDTARVCKGYKRTRSLTYSLLAAVA
jgi:uncharacterized protein (DUF1501 family)